MACRDPVTALFTGDPPPFADMGCEMVQHVDSHLNPSGKIYVMAHILVICNGKQQASERVHFLKFHLVKHFVTFANGGLAIPEPLQVMLVLRSSGDMYANVMTTTV